MFWEIGHMFKTQPDRVVTMNDVGFAVGCLVNVERGVNWRGSGRFVLQVGVPILVGSVEPCGNFILIKEEPLLALGFRHGSMHKRFFGLSHIILG